MIRKKSGWQTPGGQFCETRLEALEKESEEVLNDLNFPVDVFGTIDPQEVGHWMVENKSEIRAFLHVLDLAETERKRPALKKQASKAKTKPKAKQKPKVAAVK